MVFEIITNDLNMALMNFEIDHTHATYIMHMSAFLVRALKTSKYRTRRLFYEINVLNKIFDCGF